MNSVLGYYYMDISDPKLTGPLATTKFLRDEQGVEANYNIALAPWLKFTPDIWMMRPTQKETLAVLPERQEDIKTATLIGFRLQIIF